MSTVTPKSRLCSQLIIAGTSIFLAASICVYIVLAAISISTSTPYTQNFDSIGTSPTATLPTDFRVDRTATSTTSDVRKVGTFAAAGTTTTQLGGANLSSSAANGIYNFGSGTTTTGPDRAIGFLASGTATASGNLYAQLVNNTGGDLSGLQISYNVEKYRNGSNAAGFRIQMFYSTDGSTWTSAGNNFFTSFPADANNNGFATAPGATVAVTDQLLNVSIVSGSNFYLAWNYSVTSGTTVTNAQALAVDDISILGMAGSPTTNPTGSGSASPNSVFAGGSTLLTVNVTPGANPTSTGLAVSADLSSIGGSATQAFSGNGNTFTFSAIVSNATTAGNKSLPFTITDDQSRTGSGSINLTVKTAPPPNDVVISQVYGGGGNSGSTFKNDFIELVNHSSAPVNLDGWSLQVFSGGTWVSTPLTNFTLQPGQYYLVQESQGAGGTDALPTPDATGGILMSATSSKVALVNNTNLLTGTCPDSDPGAFGIVDFVGYGSTDCWEGSAAAPLLDNTTAELRRNEGCFDTNDNAADFTQGGPNPRNSSSPTHDCTMLFGYGSANPGSVVVGNNVGLTVDVAPAQNPASTGITVIADLSSLGGSPNQPFSGSENIFTFNAAVSQNTTAGFKSLPVTISDAQARTFNTNIVLSVLPLVPDHITISQIYGGGGNSGATYTNDYVELYNPTGSAATVTGWSIQYASATGTSWTNKQPIGGTIGPGEYLLVGLASGGANGAPLPPSQISGTINMSATAGKVALVKNSDSLAGSCPLGTDPDIVDFVGYGSTANCHEGSADAPAPSNTTAIFRKNNGAQDTDQNGSDFLTGAPNPRQTAPIVELGPWVAGTDPTTNGNTVPHDASITIDFSEPVDVDSGWFNINCAATGLHNEATVAHTNNFKTYAVTPNTNFQFSEQCTVTILKTAVHDQDTDDSAPDTDTLLEDYTWSFTVVADNQQPPPYPPSVHLTMGDPGCGTPLGCAVASTRQPNNFLMEKPTYALSYNRDKGTPNWVSWHLEPAWYGTLARVDVFRPDPAVPPDWYRVQAFDYSGTGFDRGHMTPNADRDNQFRVPINQETYLMSNMVPQAPDNNQGPWAALEGDLRTLADGGNELYIVSGPLGAGGTGSNGGTTTSFANGQVTVPAYTWKVALVLPKQDGDDVSRVTCSTRTIAVLMPNVQGIRNNAWQTYLTTVDDIEQQTGFDFFSNLPPAVQACIEAGTNGTNPPGTANQSATTAEDNSVNIALTALQSTNNTLTFSIVDQPAHGQLGTVGSSSCANGSCTASVTYTPNQDFNGSDSFSFKATDGTLTSNTSTVSIAITEVNDAPVANSQSVATNSNSPAAITLTGSDVETPSGSLTFTITSGPGHGSLSGSGSNRTYTPALNYAGADSFKFTVTDTGDGTSPALTSSEATVSITVNDTVPPVITLNGNSISLWPLDKSPHAINVSDLVATATDNFDPNVNPGSVVIASVSSDEGTAANGDIVIAGDCKSVQLIADRNGDGDGRVYTITLRARDAAGNTSFVTAKVTVPHDQANAGAIDSGPAYTINSSCP